jgi:hypothetical protein
VGFTDTSAGNLALSVGDDPAAVARRRDGLETSLGLAPGSLRFMTQVHGNDVARIGAGSRGAPTADAMVSLDAPLAVLVADCVPVVLVGRRPGATPVLAVAHAGRAGVSSRVVPRTVEALRGAGAVSVRAWLGPSVCGSCYEVPAALRDQVCADDPAAHATTSWGTPSLDLPAAVLSQLAGCGVHAERIAGCTLEEPRLFSHRRGTPAGRFAGVVYAGR